MKLTRSFVVALALAAASSPAAARAQEAPCQPQAAAVEAASLAAAPIDEAFAQTFEQLAALAVPVASEAPELVPVQSELLSQLTSIQQSAVLQGAGVGPADSAAAEAAAAAAWATIDADIVRLQSGLVGNDGSPRPNVSVVANLAQQARDQAQAMADANQNLLSAVQALTACAEAASG